MAEDGELTGERVAIGDTVGVITETRKGAMTRHTVTAEIGGVMQGVTVTDEYAREHLAAGGGA